jgi:drug/metabolite transporter (DMT)-like permease
VPSLPRGDAFAKIIGDSLPLGQVVTMRVLVQALVLVPFAVLTGRSMALNARVFGAHLLMAWSLRFAPAATLATLQYLEIPFATLIGYAIFRELPNDLAAFGILITIGSGLYVIHSERRLKPLPSAAEL